MGVTYKNDSHDKGDKVFNAFDLLCCNAMRDYILLLETEVWAEA
jgi:hypothetical protein